MDTGNRDKTTVRYGSEMINLRVPLTLLPLITNHARDLGISRSKLLIEGALLMINQTTEGQVVQTTQAIK